MSVVASKIYWTYKSEYLNEDKLKAGSDVSGAEIFKIWLLVKLLIKKSFKMHSIFWKLASEPVLAQFRIVGRSQEDEKQSVKSAFN